MSLWRLLSWSLLPQAQLVKLHRQGEACEASEDCGDLDCSCLALNRGLRICEPRGLERFEGFSKRLKGDFKRAFSRDLKEILKIFIDFQELWRLPQAPRALRGLGTPGFELRGASAKRCAAHDGAPSGAGLSGPLERAGAQDVGGRAGPRQIFNHFSICL